MNEGRYFSAGEIRRSSLWELVADAVGRGEIEVLDTASPPPDYSGVTGDAN